MPRRTKSISLLLVAAALSLTGNIYAEITPMKPSMDVIQQDGKVTAKYGCYTARWKSHRYSC